MEREDGKEGSRRRRERVQDRGKELSKEGIKEK